MPGDKSVVDGLTGFGEARNAPVLAEGRKAVAASGQDLVGVALMSDVENEPVPRRVIDPVNRQRQLDRAEIGGKMAAGSGDAIDLKLPQLPAERTELGAIQLFDIIG